MSVLSVASFVALALAASPAAPADTSADPTRADPRRADQPAARPADLSVSSTAAAAVEQRMRDAAHAIEATPGVAKMTRAEQRALIAIARDAKQSVYARARALGLCGAIPDDAAFALWREARAWPQRELRVQAAWAEGLARKRGPRFLPYARALLAEEEAHLREVGVHLLFIEGSAAAIALAKQHAAIEPDPVVAKLLARRLSD